MLSTLTNPSIVSTYTLPAGWKVAAALEEVANLQPPVHALIDAVRRSDDDDVSSPRLNAQADLPILPIPQTCPFCPHSLTRTRACALIHRNRARW